MNSRIYLSPPHLTGEEINTIQDALKSNWIAPVGPHVDAFEQELAQTLKTSYAVAVNSGTAAIHLGLLALGIKSGDEVICPTFTFCASVNPVIYCGAKPIFVDSEKDSWNMDPVLLEEALHDRFKNTGKYPKAIIVVHLYGMPAKIDDIMNVSRKYSIPVLEDAAEALGSNFHDKPLGSFGEIGIISFNGNKIITTSGGGALFSSDPALVEKARYFRQEAKEPTPYYEHKEIGFNYRLSNVLAALGRSQLKVLSERVKKRREIFSFYQQELGTLNGVTFQPELKGAYSNRWLTAVVFDQSSATPETIRKALEKQNIESRPLWKPMHLQPVFKGSEVYNRGVSEDLFRWGLCLPSGSALSTDDLHRIVRTIKQLF